MGVFRIRNTENEKIFIGSSTDLVSIWNRLRFQLNNGLCSNAGLQADWSRSGEEKFVYEILSEIKEEERITDYKGETEQLEKMFIEELQPFGARGYNIEKRSG